MLALRCLAFSREVVTWSNSLSSSSQLLNALVAGSSSTGRQSMGQGGGSRSAICFCSLSRHFLPAPVKFSTFEIRQCSKMRESPIIVLPARPRESPIIVALGRPLKSPMIVATARPRGSPWDRAGPPVAQPRSRQSLIGVALTRQSDSLVVATQSQWRKRPRIAVTIARISYKMAFAEVQRRPPKPYRKCLERVGCFGTSPRSLRGTANHADEHGRASEGTRRTLDTGWGERHWLRWLTFMSGGILI